MRWSQTFIPTLREVPADAEVVSHRLLLRAGLVRQLAAGIYSYLPLAQRVILRIQKILREEMNAINGQEFLLPALNPREIWEESGRWSVMGDNMFRLKDRKGSDLCLAMTHEEVFTSIARHEIRSYKQLPQVWYQIQTKFRDEARPKSGVLRVRQFIMKDAYSFDVDFAGLDKSFADQREAYKRIFDRCGLQYVIVEASSGAMGGSASNEFMVKTDAGEDLIATCDNCGYAANLEKATSKLVAIVDEDGPGSPEKFPTPGVRTIEDLTTFAGGAAADRQIKTLVFVATRDGESEYVLALLRGDHQLHETKLSDSLGAAELTAEGKEVPIVMGCYGIGVERIMAAAIELHHDEDGIIWPRSIAPFDVVVTITNLKQDEIRNSGERLYTELHLAGLEVLLDDRDERAGVKFKDADLIGIPFRVTVGKKIGDGLVELFDRRTKTSVDISINEVVARVQELALS